MDMTRWGVSLFVVGLLSLCLFASFLTSAPWRPVTQETLSELRVYAYRDWQSTGYTVQPGERVTIRASGEWMYSPQAGYNGPDGHPVFRSPSFYPLPGVGGGALIGRIGEDGQPFYVGRQTGHFAGRESAAGRGERGLLYLRIDDDRLGDNRGYVTVQITVTKPQ
jgi:hypothetical protein